jgi:PAS domain S-box-containing protein
VGAGEDAPVDRVAGTPPRFCLTKPVRKLELRSAVDTILAYREMELRLKRSEKRFRDFLENLGDAAYAADLSGHVTYANRMAEEIVGLPRERILDKYFLEVFSEECKEKAREVGRRILQGETPECELTFISGKTCHFKNELLRDESGEIVGMFGTARDISDIKRASEQLTRAHEELERRVEERTAELREINERLRNEITER